MSKALKITMLPMLVVLALFMFVNFPILNGKANAENGCAGLEEFYTFNDQLNDMVSTYGNGVGTVSFDEEEVVNINNVQMVSESSLNAVSGIEISRYGADYTITSGNKQVILSVDSPEWLVNDGICVVQSPAVQQQSTTYLPIVDVMNVLGYDPTESELVYSRAFSSMRLLLRANSAPEACGAIAKCNFDDLYIYQYATEEDAESAYKYYKTLSTIYACEPDSIITLDDYIESGNSNQTSNATTTTSTSSMSDTIYTWGYDAMGVGDYISHLNEINSLNEVVVAVLDTGVDMDHDMYKDKLLLDYAYDVTDSDDRANVEDTSGHGTHVTGIISQLTLDNVKIIPVKIFADNEDETTISCAVSALAYIKQLNESVKHVDVINCSYGATYWMGVGFQGMTEDELLQDEYIDDLFENGTITVVAAGNEYTDVKYSFPASTESAITVTSIEQYKGTYRSAKSEGITYSNYGEYIDVCAPGNDIESAGLNNTTEIRSGTSMATPHVTAAVALFLSDSTQTLNPTGLTELITTYVIDLDKPGWDAYYGTGMVQLSLKDTITLSDTTLPHTESFNLTISHTMGNASLYYTLDGSTPTTSSIPYTGPITISSTTTVKARSFLVGHRSEVCSVSYDFNYDYADAYSDFIVTDEGVLVSYIGSASDVIVPDVVNGITIKTIGDGKTHVFGDLYITSVVLPSSATIISRAAFNCCYDLQSVMAPGITSIGDVAFAGCYKLGHIDDAHFPELLSVGGDAFNGCGVNSVENMYVYLSKLTTAGEYAFSAMTNVVSISLNSLTDAGDGIFRDCLDVTSISISSLTYITENMFYNCRSLTTLNMPQVNEIPTKAFYMCYKLNDIEMESVTIIGSSAFYSCRALKNAYLPNLVRIGSSVFANSGVEWVFIGKGLSEYSKSSIESDITIYCYSNSTAHTYAQTYSIPFVLVDPFAIVNDLPSADTVKQYDSYTLSITVSGLAMKYDWYSYTTGSHYLFATTDVGEYTMNSVKNSKYIYAVITYWDGTTLTSNTLYLSVQNNTTDELASYSVQHWVQRSWDQSNTYDCKMSESSGGIVGRETDASASIFTNYYALPFNQETILADGSTVVNIYYNLVSYSVCLNLDSGVVVWQDKLAYTNYTIVSYQVGAEIQLELKLKDGYGFVGWKTSGVTLDDTSALTIKFTMPSQDVVLTPEVTLKQYYITLVSGENGTVAVYSGSQCVQYGEHSIISITPNAGYVTSKLLIDSKSVPVVSVYPFYGVNANHTVEATFVAGSVNYTVRHWQESLTDTGTLYNDKYYVECDSEVITGTTGEMTSAVVKTYTGFTSQSFSQATILGDGSTVVDVYYHRNTYKVTVRYGTGISGVTVNGTAKATSSSTTITYGASVSVVATPQEGYNFSSWTATGVTLTSNTSATQTFTMPASAVTLTANASTQTYAITINAGEHGSAIVTSGSNPAPYGSSVIITISPDTGYKIATLVVDGVSQTPSTTYTFNNVTEAHTLTVTFVADTVTYTVIHWQENLTGTGTLYNGKYYTEFDSEVLTGSTGETTNAVAKTYEGFTAQAISQGTITADSSTVVNIYYNRNTYKVTIKYGTGISGVTVNGTAKATSSSTTITYGANVSVVATPQTGYSFSSWTATGVTLTSNTSATQTFTMPASAVTLTANASTQTFAITINASEHGDVVITSGVNPAPYGSDVVITITPDEGYKIGTLVVDGASQTPNTIVTFNDIKETHIIEVTFVVSNATYTVKHWQQSLTDVGTLVEGKYYAEHESETLNGVIGENTVAQAKEYTGFTAQSFSQTTVLEDCSAVVNIYYNRELYYLKATLSDGTMGTINGQTINEYVSANFKYGEEVTITISCSEGYTFTGWQYSGITLNDANAQTLTFTMPNRIVRLTATSTLQTFAITIDVGENGSVAIVSGTNPASYGSSVKLTITADKGYRIKSLVIDNESIEVVETYTFENITREHTIKVEFEQVEDEEVTSMDLSQYLPFVLIGCGALVLIVAIFSITGRRRKYR